MATSCSVYVEDGSKADRSVREVALKLISDGLESKLLFVFESLLSATYPESMVSSLTIFFINSNLSIRREHYTVHCNCHSQLFSH